ncbi:hypothetical protein Ga0609869_000574 [Rhodovulum iodosum]|uniref:Putative DNA-binding domain-containing protein n=1 Tax=Rhodovulum iodosum TaxID=68291 RepID=A0ABV3XPG9_9RHOB|nr:DNA-binding domain-containing protein [Rhodovulum robiginosum]RSK31486.1 DUF2063 domain-containing protein [Rhodovulum robiginosum]
MVRQGEFTQALLDPSAAVPPGLTGPDGRPAGKRFAVYRNNVAVSLTKALETGFPVVRKLVGDDFFTAMAGVFLRSHPPRSPRLTLYGETFPAFLEGFGPAQRLVYLPDVARLEMALRESYHAADSDPIAPDALAALPPEALMGARLHLAPALRLIRSRWPVFGIWRANTAAAAPKPAAGPEDVLVVRPGYDPVPLPLPPGGGGFVAALMHGRPLGEAVAAAEEECQDFNLSAVLQILLDHAALVDVTGEDAP